MRKYFREPINGLTHFFGIFLAISGLVALLTRVEPVLTTTHIVSFAIFSSGMILLYTFSTLYHWLPLTGKKLETFRRIDHIMIFVFIAASYTPICLITLKGAWGWSLLGGVWAITLAGFFMKLYWLHAPRYLYTLLYLLMGWFLTIAIWPLIHNMVPKGLLWLIIGGLSYSIGATIYAVKKPNPWPNVFGFHEIFHLFILLGSFSHIVMMHGYV